MGQFGQWIGNAADILGCHCKKKTDWLNAVIVKCSWQNNFLFISSIIANPSFISSHLLSLKIPGGHCHLYGVLLSFIMPWKPISIKRLLPSYPHILPQHIFYLPIMTITGFNFSHYIAMKSTVWFHQYWDQLLVWPMSCVLVFFSGLKSFRVRVLSIPRLYQVWSVETPLVLFRSITLHKYSAVILIS